MPDDYLDQEFLPPPPDDYNPAPDWQDFEATDEQPQEQETVPELDAAPPQETPEPPPAEDAPADEPVEAPPPPDVPEAPPPAPDPAPEAPGAVDEKQPVSFRETWQDLMDQEIQLRKEDGLEDTQPWAEIDARAREFMKDNYGWQQSPALDEDDAKADQVQEANDAFYANLRAADGDFG